MKQIYTTYFSRKAPMKVFVRLCCASLNDEFVAKYMLENAIKTNEDYNTVLENLSEGDIKYKGHFIDMKQWNSKFKSVTLNSHSYSNNSYIGTIAEVNDKYYLIICSDQVKKKYSIDRGGWYVLSVKDMIENNYKQIELPAVWKNYFLDMSEVEKRIPAVSELDPRNMMQRNMIVQTYFPQVLSYLNPIFERYFPGWLANFQLA